MPFQSEKQRRYLWANEPEIARDWTDTYGSGIAKALGGRIPFAYGSGFEDITTPGYYTLSPEKRVYKEALKLKDSQKLGEWLDANPTLKSDYSSKIMDALKFDETDKRVSGKVEAAGGKFFNQFPGWTDKGQQESALPFMKTLEYLKHTKGLNEFDAKRAFEKLRQADPEGFEEKYGIDSYEDIGNAIEKGYDEARLSNEEWLDARQLTADSGMFGTDANIVDKITPQTRGPMGDEMWARPPEGLASINPHGWEYGNQWQEPDQQSGSKSNLLLSALNYLPFVGKHTRTGAFMRMLKNRFMPEGGITSMFNRPTTPQQQATQRFMQNYNVGRNPQTGRMVGGPFAGQNAPGTSMFGSKTPKEMAQKWMKKYGKMNYQTRPQQLKQQQIKNIATMNQGPAGITPKAPTRPVHSGQPTGGHHEGGGGGIGSTASRQGPAGGSVGASRFRSRGGRLYNTGGLAGLWQR